MENSRKIDLNLLLTLDKLLSENNVSRAAEQLNLSQPAVSIQLAKLRHLFADPLLIPGPRGMQPTIRAEQLRQPLHQALENLQQAIAPTEFDPALTTHSWCVAASDYSSSTILLPILRQLRIQAPARRLAIVENIPSQITRKTTASAF